LISEERVKTALAHSEPDRVPYDLGGTLITGIHVKAYKRLVAHLGIEKSDFPVLRERLGIADIHEDVLQRLSVDVRPIFPNELTKTYSEDEEYDYYVDEWGVKWRRPKEGGLYFDLYESPMRGDISQADIDGYPWPDFKNAKIKEGLKEKAIELRKRSKCALVLESVLGGEMFDGCFFLRGFENFYIDLAINPTEACYLMDKMLELQLQYWNNVLPELKEDILIARIGDDLGEQANTRISPEMYRNYVKPRHEKLFRSVKKIGGGNVYIFLHSDGSIYDLIPDLIEAGVDILNPIQYNTVNMDTARLKKEFGSDLTFWGGGIDTQKILPQGSVQEIKDEVKRRIDDLAPGGGFVFCQVHNIQYDVPPENYMAMWEALQEHGKY
jgi:uroporphyrinogen decarboxylase